MRTRAGAALSVVAALALSGCQGEADRDSGATEVVSPGGTTDVDPEATTEDSAATDSGDETTGSDSDDAGTDAPSDEGDGTGGQDAGAAEDEADVRSAVEEYLATLDAIGQGEADVSELDGVVDAAPRQQWLDQFDFEETEGWVQVGDQVLADAGVELLGDQATVSACLDVTDVDVVDATGESIVPEDRLDRSLNDYLLERRDGTEHGWIVVDDVNLGVPCEI